jgi:hypothetical protein
MGERSTEGGDRPQTSRRYTVQGAAQALGVSVEAVRGRIKRGTIEHVREGGTVYVLLEPPPSDQPPPGRDQPADQSRLVEVLEDQVDHLRRQLEAERAAHGESRRIIAGLVQRIPELERPPASADEAEMVGESAGGVEDPGESAEPEAATSQRRSWWRRLLGR